MEDEWKDIEWVDGRVEGVRDRWMIRWKEE